MKKVFALSLVAVLCIAVVAIAGDDKMAGKKMGGMSGTITKVDMAGKMMMVKDSAGKESAVYWNDTTKVEGGDVKEGAMVQYNAAKPDKEIIGRTDIHVWDWPTGGSLDLWNCDFGVTGGVSRYQLHGYEHEHGLHVDGRHARDTGLRLSSWRVG